MKTVAAGSLTGSRLASNPVVDLELKVSLHSGSMRVSIAKNWMDRSASLGYGEIQSEIPATATQFRAYVIEEIEECIKDWWRTMVE